MTYSVKITNQADEDMRRIYAYIALTLESEQNAVRQITRLRDNINSLDIMPERYRRYLKEPWYGLGWRIMTVDNFCVMYTVDYEQRVVDIMSVIYGGRDVDRVLAEFEGSTN